MSSQDNNKSISQKFSDYIDAKTAYYQKLYDFEYNQNDRKHAFWNNEADAFKHAFMQAKLTFDYTTLPAKIVGDFHELDGALKKQPISEMIMDLWNNAVGRKIGREVKDELLGKEKLSQNKLDDIIAEKIMQKMRKGELITSPYKGNITGKASPLDPSDPFNEKGFLNADKSVKENFIKNSGLGRDDYNNLFGFSKNFNINNANFRPAESFDSDFLKAIGLTREQYNNLFDFTQRVQEIPPKPQSDNAFHNQFLNAIGLTQQQYDNLFDFTNRVHVPDNVLNGGSMSNYDIGVNNALMGNSYSFNSTPPPTIMLDSNVNLLRQILTSAVPGGFLNNIINRYINGDENCVHQLLDGLHLSDYSFIRAAFYNSSNTPGIDNFNVNGLVGGFDQPIDTRIC